MSATTTPTNRRSPRPIYHTNIQRQRPRPAKPEPKLGLLDGVAGRAGKAGAVIAGCAGLFLTFVLLSSLSVLSLIGMAAYTVLSHF